MDIFLLKTYVFVGRLTDGQQVSVKAEQPQNWPHGYQIDHTNEHRGRAVLDRLEEDTFFFGY